MLTRQKYPKKLTVGLIGFVLSALFVQFQVAFAGNNAVSYLGTDANTQGNWKGVYGADGYEIFDAGVSLPSYATMSCDGGNYAWNSSTTDVRGLQKPGQATDRIAAVKYSNASETIEMTIAGETAKNVAVYALDWDGNDGRAMTVQAVDGETGTVYNTQDVRYFSSGKYLRYSVKGHIKFIFNSIGGANASYSGVFFGGSGFASASVAAATPNDSVSVTFGDDYVENGIRTWNDNLSGGKVYAGESGLQTDLAQGAGVIYGDVSDKFIHDGKSKIKVTVEYWDGLAVGKESGEEGFTFNYDSIQSPWVTASKTYLEGSNTWKTATYYIDNARFAGRENGADFRLYSVDTDVCLRSITIEKVPDVVPVTGVSIVPGSVNFSESERKNLTAVFVPSYATNKFITWSSGNPAVATVNSLGQVTGVAAGTTVITAAVQDNGPKAVCNVKVTAVPGTGTIATRAGDFLDSIGMNSSINGRGETLQKTIDCMKYLGARWIRSGIGLKMQDYTDLYNAAGVRFSLGFGGDLNRFVKEARKIADGGMLLAFEGPNEPNNWGFAYQDEMGGGGGPTWIPLAKFQRDFYSAVKSDPVLRNYPVWSLSETGAETDNVGLQFLAVPKGAGTVMPEGTQYADYATCHNYCCHPSWQGLHDNQAWLSSDPTSACPVDGLYGEFGRTWAKKFPGYSDADLLTLPRVTTETGITVDATVTEEIQARLYLDVYLSQFKRGWSYTSIYIMRDRSDEAGNQSFGFYKPDYTPRKAAVYLHNFTSILADSGSIQTPGRLNYSIPNQPETVHEMLLQKNNGKFCLVVWNERYGSGGSDNITVNLGAAFKTVNVYDPTVNTRAVKTFRNISSVNLTLSNNPAVIEL